MLTPIMLLFVCFVCLFVCVQVRWSRKGYLHTRWRMFGRYGKGSSIQKPQFTLMLLPLLCSRTLNLVNIHLFHDDDNLIALEQVSTV